MKPEEYRVYRFKSEGRIIYYASATEKVHWLVETELPTYMIIRRNLPCALFHGNQSWCATKSMEFVELVKERNKYATKSKTISS